MPESATQDILQKPETNQALHWAIHQFFKEISQDSPYAIMLGGSIWGMPLNQQLLIGLQPTQVIRVIGKTLHHDTLDGTTTLTLDSSKTLFDYLRAQAWTQSAFIQTDYEFYRFCDSALWNLKQKHADNNALTVIGFSETARFDLNEHQWRWNNTGEETAQRYQTLWQNLLDSPSEGFPKQQKSLIEKALLEDYKKTFTTSFSKDSFEDSVKAVRQHIQQGDIYQANLSLSLEKNVQISCPYEFYAELCLNSPAPFCAFVKSPSGFLISNSPERLLKADIIKNKKIQLSTRPIAGTRGRGKTTDDDQWIAETLLNNPKERAEHLMLVDLLRNDLGKVSSAGSVTVDELLTIERYSRVMHLVSNVIGELSPQVDYWDALQALFPGGTITGCPKVRCIEILNRQEPVARGFYTGSLGYLNTKQNTWGEATLDLNILIRTLQLTPLNNSHLQTGNTLVPQAPSLAYNALSDGRYQARLHVGAGIVQDSVAEHEYRECYRKAEALLGALYVSEQSAKRTSNDPDKS